jgi:hypothetical protein
MTIDEQELGWLLDETADLASAPRFTAEELIRRAGRRRARITTAAFGAVAGVAGVAGIAAVAAVANVPSAPSGRSQPPDISRPAPSPPIHMSYRVTVNGRTQEIPFGSGAADYVVKPAEHLSIIVDMTIPTGTSVKVTGLWMGIVNNLLSRSPLYLDMAPVLVADPRASIGPGTYKFTLHWVAPAGLRPGDSRQLSVEADEPDGEENPIIAVFNVH